VELVRYAESDRELTLALETDPRVVGHLGGPGTEQDAVRVHEQRVRAAAEGGLVYTIVPEPGAEPVGVVAIWKSEFESSPVHELGIMLLPDHQAQGLGGRAIRRLLPGARERGITELHVFPAVTNDPSNTVAGRLGFRRLPDCDLDYEGRPLRCTHWVLNLDEALGSDPA
jgi:RimJ/RimL family protein N-acetyltransferase